MGANSTFMLTAGEQRGAARPRRLRPRSLPAAAPLCRRGPGPPRLVAQGRAPSRRRRCPRPRGPGAAPSRRGRGRRPPGLQPAPGTLRPRAPAERRCYTTTTTTRNPVTAASNAASTALTAANGSNGLPSPRCAAAAASPAGSAGAQRGAASPQGGRCHLCLIPPPAPPAHPRP